MKFLHFCDVCDIPIILVLYEAKSQKAYWLWTQNYIYSELDINNDQWRNNEDKVNIKLPISNLVSQEENFFNSFKQIANQGINQISQIRKSKTHQNYYTVIKQKDQSHGNLRRIQVKILVEKSFASSQDATKLIIPKINQGFINSDYYRSDITKKYFVNNESDIVWLFFYDNPLQVDNGLPFCRTEWIKDNDKVEPVIFTNNDYDELVDNIKIKWDENYLIISDHMQNNQLTKGQYFDLAQKIYANFCILYNQIKEITKKFYKNKISFNEVKNKILVLTDNLDQLNFQISEIGYTPYECRDMHQRLIQIVSYLHNIAIVFNDSNREENNLEYLLNMCIDDIDKIKPFYEYERDKAK